MARTRAARATVPSRCRRVSSGPGRCRSRGPFPPRRANLTGSVYATSHGSADLAGASGQLAEAMAAGFGPLHLAGAFGISEHTAIGSVMPVLRPAADRAGPSGERHGFSGEPGPGGRGTARAAPARPALREVTTASAGHGQAARHPRRRVARSVQTGGVAEIRCCRAASSTVSSGTGTRCGRNPGNRARSFAHKLLRHLEQRGWPGAPRLLGVDGQGREVLDLPGRLRRLASSDRPGNSPGSLAEVARLALRPVPRPGQPEHPCRATRKWSVTTTFPPRTRVYRDNGEEHAPGRFHRLGHSSTRRPHPDVAHMCWQYLNLGPAVDDLNAASHRVRLMCDAYGLDDRSPVVETILWWQDRCWRGIDAATRRWQACGPPGPSGPYAPPTTGFSGTGPRSKPPWPDRTPQG